jgi:Cu/Ag efflux pump CusA
MKPRAREAPQRQREILSGFASGLAVNVFGSDLNVLDQKSRQVARALSGIRGVADVTLPSIAHFLSPWHLRGFRRYHRGEGATHQELLVHSLLAGFGIILLLSIVMHNYRNLLLVLANLPFALVGGIVAAWATGGNLSLGGLVGFVTPFGITLRNSIMMISHYEHLVEREGMTWGLGTALRGRFRTAGTDSDDSPCDRAWSAPPGARQWRSWPRNRRSDGHRHLRRISNLDGA